MSRLRTTEGRVAVGSLVVLLMSCLPVIPVLQSPVVPDPVARSAWICLLQLLAGAFLVGVRIEATSMTLPVVVALAAAMWFVIRFLNRRIFRRS